MNSDTVANQGTKILFVWGGIVISSWAEAASFLAFILSALALGEYLWKKIIRPILVRTGRIAPRPKKLQLVEVEVGDE
jgi:hypothetical protein